MASQISGHGLRALTRRDGVILLRFSSSSKALPALIEEVFSPRLLFTLSPSGDVALVLPDHAWKENPPPLPAETKFHVLRALCIIDAIGDGMSGAGSTACCICAALARAGIIIHALSMSDIGIRLVLEEAQADRAMDIICRAVPMLK